MLFATFESSVKVLNAVVSTAHRHGACPDFDCLYRLEICPDPGPDPEHHLGRRRCVPSACRVADAG